MGRVDLSFHEVSARPASPAGQHGAGSGCGGKGGCALVGGRGGPGGTEWRPNLGSCPAGVRGREAGRQNLSGPAFSELAALPRSPARWGAEQRRWVQRQGRSPPRPRLPGGEGAGDSGSQKRGACCLFSGVAAGVIRVFYPVYCKCSMFLPQY